MPRARLPRSERASSLFSGGYLKKADFIYFADSRPKEMDNVVDATFDRKFKFDFAGRLSSSEFGLYTTQHNGDVNPHQQAISYDAFSQITERQTDQWGDDYSFTQSYTNGRISGPTYNASGNIVSSLAGTSGSQVTTYDTAGRVVESKNRWAITGTGIVAERVGSIVHDGDGRVVKSVWRTDRISPTPSTGTAETTFEVYSTVLGETLTSINGSDESKIETKVFAGGAQIAKQKLGAVYWIHADPVTGSKQETSQSGEWSVQIGAREEYEPMGQSVRTSPPFEEEPPPNPPPPVRDSMFPEWQCSLPTQLLPTHCALKMIEDLRGVFLGTISIKNNEGIPTKLNDNPLPTFNPTDGGPVYASRAVNSFALTSTSKKLLDDDDDGIGCDPSNPKSCQVKIKIPKEPEEDDDKVPVEPEIPGFIDASEGSEPGAVVEDHCRRMVGKLREIMAQSLNAIGPIKNMAGVDKLITEIDSAFHGFFVGPMNFSSTQALHGPPVGYYGATGFKPEFVDSLFPQDDQAHHFVQYFHAGIWATQSWKAYAHSVTDLIPPSNYNKGDLALGSAAFDLGTSLRIQQIGSKERVNRNNPRAVFTEKVSWEDRRKRVFGISDAILNKICD